MAVDLINAVLDAEKLARNEESAAKKKAQEIVAEAQKQAEQLTASVIEQAQNEAVLIASEADLTADGIIKQAEKLALLRERKVISDTEKRYDECIAIVLDNLV